jgi:spermidine/putrescine transport system permease protein
LLRREWVRGYALLAPGVAVMVALLAAPLVLILLASFWTQNDFTLDRSFTLANYETFFDYKDSPIFLTLLLRSIVMAATATLAVILLAYPAAYFIAFRVRKGKLVWLMMLSIPFWVSYLLRIFSWKIILGYDGVINASLMHMGLIKAPFEFLLYNPASVTITLAHAWAAYAVLPIYVSLEKIDKSVMEASVDLGDNPITRFLRVTLPLSAPGTIAAVLLVFVPTVGDYVTPSLVGGPGGVMIGNLIQSLFGRSNNAPLAAAASISMMVVVTAIILPLLWFVRRPPTKL